MRLPALLIAFSILSGLARTATAQAPSAGGDQPATKENLDLPFDAFALSEDEEEPPEVVFFYGQQYEGGGFFFCLDRSGSTRQGELDIEKRETIRSITQFSNKVQFAVTFFDQGALSWPSTGRPAEADAGSKSQAIAWLATVQHGRGSCVREGLLESIKIADRSTARRNVIIWLGDGGTQCAGHDRAQYGQQTLVLVAAANYKRHAINTICVGSDQVDEQWCQTLASMNNGTYKRVPR